MVGDDGTRDHSRAHAAASPQAVRLTSGSAPREGALFLDDPKQHRALTLGGDGCESIHIERCGRKHR